jgi:hypothetical protein
MRQTRSKWTCTAVTGGSVVVLIEDVPAAPMRLPTGSAAPSVFSPRHPIWQRGHPGRFASLVQGHLKMV